VAPHETPESRSPSTPNPLARAIRRLFRTIPDSAPPTLSGQVADSPNHNAEFVPPVSPVLPVIPAQSAPFDPPVTSVTSVASVALTGSSAPGTERSAQQPEERPSGRRPSGAPSSGPSSSGPSSAVAAAAAERAAAAVPFVERVVPNLKPVNLHGHEPLIGIPAPNSVPAPTGQRVRRAIPQDVKIAVSVRDGGRCRQCGSTHQLHFDHVIPVSRGGANTPANVQLLCGPCNRAKAAKLRLAVPPFGPQPARPVACGRSPYRGVRGSSPRGGADFPAG
jgi:hypothetical protein